MSEMVERLTSGGGTEMTDARIKAEQLAAEKWPGRPDGDIPLTNMKRKAFIDGYLTARTVTAEELEAAAEGMWNRHGTRGLFAYAPEHMRMAFLRDACAALEAAGLLIEGDDS